MIDLIRLAVYTNDIAVVFGNIWVNAPVVVLVRHQRVGGWSVQVRGRPAVVFLRRGGGLLGLCVVSWGGQRECTFNVGGARPGVLGSAVDILQ